MALPFAGSQHSCVCGCERCAYCFHWTFLANLIWFVQILGIFVQYKFQSYTLPIYRYESFKKAESAWINCVHFEQYWCESVRVRILSSSIPVHRSTKSTNYICCIDEEPLKIIARHAETCVALKTTFRQIKNSNSHKYYGRNYRFAVGFSI